jgi:hypothetical protein
MVPAGHSVDPVRWHGELDALLGRVAAVPDPCPATRCTSCHVRGAAAMPTPVATLVTGGREAAGGAAHLSGREAAADTSMAADASLTTAGHQLSGGRSFRNHRTVNPTDRPVVTTFSTLPQGRPAGGRLRRPSSARRTHISWWTAPTLRPAR